jgi:hypothetical protein
MVMVFLMLLLTPKVTSAFAFFLSLFSLVDCTDAGGDATARLTHLCVDVNDPFVSHATAASGTASASGASAVPMPHFGLVARAPLDERGQPLYISPVAEIDMALNEVRA